jgi:hypothetical protein
VTDPAGSRSPSQAPVILATGNWLRGSGRPGGHFRGRRRGAYLISGLDIYRAAKLLIDQHGEDTPIRAAQRAGELLRDGDTEGAAIWRVIMSAIEELQRGRHEGEPLN